MIRATIGFMSPHINSIKVSISYKQVSSPHHHHFPKRPFTKLSLVTLFCGNKISNQINFPQFYRIMIYSWAIIDGLLVLR